MSDELCALHNYALALRQINMLQVAGDFDYLAAWLNSSEWTDGYHLKPDPAGENTIDAYSNNCPIPYTACRKITDCCTDLYTASSVVNSAKSILQSLLDIYTDEVEQTAIKAYLDYVDSLIYLIDGVEPEPPTPPVPSYEEITLYANMSTTIYCQRNITNHTSEVINTSNIVTLYTDEEKTKPFEFNYSNEYELGYYSSTTGEWVPRSIQSINDMPTTTANRGAGETVTCAFLLIGINYMTGNLWFVCNNSDPNYVYTNQHAGFYGSVKLRIRKKDQQYYAGYFNSSSTLGNVSISFGSSKTLYGAPNTGAYNIALRSDFDTYIQKTIVGFYNSAGVLVSSGYTNFGWYDHYNRHALEVYYGNRKDGTLTIRMMLFTLNHPTYTGWLSKSHTQSISVPSGENRYFYDENGEWATGDPQYLYIPIGIFSNTGMSVGTTRAIIDKFSITVGAATGNLLFKQETGSTMNFTRIWYAKVPVTAVTFYFAADKTSGAAIYSDAVALYDGDGHLVPYSNQYTVSAITAADGTTSGNWTLMQHITNNPQNASFSKYGGLDYLAFKLTGYYGTAYSLTLTLPKS